jgi:hypothetical protein
MKFSTSVSNVMALFTDAFNVSDYMALKVRMITEWKICGSNWSCSNLKVQCCPYIFMDMPSKTMTNLIMMPISGPRFEPRTSKIRSTIAEHWTFL